MKSEFFLEWKENLENRPIQAKYYIHRVAPLFSNVNMLLQISPCLARMRKHSAQGLTLAMSFILFQYFWKKWKLANYKKMAISIDF